MCTYLCKLIISNVLILFFLCLKSKVSWVNENFKGRWIVAKELIWYRTPANFLNKFLSHNIKVQGFSQRFNSYSTKAENFRIVDIEINAWSLLFINLLLKSRKLSKLQPIRVFIVQTKHPKSKPRKIKILARYQRESSHWSEKKQGNESIK